MFGKYYEFEVIVARLQQRREDVRITNNVIEHSNNTREERKESNAQTKFQIPN